MHMTAALNQFINPNDLGFRFWADGQISRFACRLGNTPHFEVASSFLSGRPFVQRYKEYVDYATQFYEQPENEKHSLDRFLANLELWKRGFDLESHPVEIAVQNGITFIVNGSHRAAFALERGDKIIPVRLTRLDEEWRWPKDVAQIDSIEEVFPQAKWIQSS